MASLLFVKLLVLVLIVQIIIRVNSMLLSPCRQDGRVKDTMGGVYEATYYRRGQRLSGLIGLYEMDNMPTVIVSAVSSYFCHAGLGT